MRKVVVTEFVALDGVFADPGGSEGTRHGGWNFPFMNEEVMKYKFDELFASDALLLGRVTYEGFARAWPTIEGAGEFGDRMNSMPKYVVSTTLEELTWNNSHLIQSNIVEEVSRLKQRQGKDILVFGSGKLVYTLTRHNLVDEYRLMFHPVVLGEGKSLFGSWTDRVTLKFLDVQTFSSGIVLLSYQTARKD